MRLRYAYERMLFHPEWYHLPLILLLLPLSLLYGTGMYLRRQCARRKAVGIPVISIGNLITGGSGKTPFTIAVASRYEKVAIISRGYGRESRGMVEVSRNGRIVAGVEESGDEPMLMAHSLPHASVIVSEKRSVAIEYAKACGAGLIVLDDGFNRVEIEKYEILLEPESVKNILPFPAGPYREFLFCRKAADIVAREGREFTRSVSYENLTDKMLLVTAISNPERLDPFLPPGVCGRVYFPDHAYFDEEELAGMMAQHGVESLLVTQKDAVKMVSFKLPLSKMKLKLEIDEEIFGKIDRYIKDFVYEK